MRPVKYMREQQLVQAALIGDKSLASRLTTVSPHTQITSSSQIVRKCINGDYSFKTRDSPPTQRPVQSESVFPSYEVYERGLPRIMGVELE